MQRRLLLVEDNDLVRGAMSRVLTAHGYDVYSAASVAEAVDLAHRNALDAILCDYHITGGTGADVIRKVRRTQDVPAVLLTGEPGAVSNADAALFVALFEKPTPIAKLVATLDRISASAHSEVRGPNERQALRARKRDGSE